MEIFYSVTGEWIGIMFHKGHHIVVDDDFEYNPIEDCILFEGTYEECRDYADNWERESGDIW